LQTTFVSGAATNVVISMVYGRTDFSAEFNFAANPSINDGGSAPPLNTWQIDVGGPGCTYVAGSPPTVLQIKLVITGDTIDHLTQGQCTLWLEYLDDPQWP
jgi:hypothetical protein